jgi:anti-sigma B factor antagonist
MFGMDLRSGECGGHVVVALRGELDIADAEAVASALVNAAAREPRIIVDLAGLEFIDASGIAALSRGRGHARGAGGDLLLAAPQRLVRRVLAIIWEGDGFAAHASVVEAAASAGAFRQAVAPIAIACRDALAGYRHGRTLAEAASGNPRLAGAIPPTVGGD